MGKMTIKLNRAGVRDLLRSEEAVEICESYANKAATQLGEGYEVTTFRGRNRANASVSAESPKAIRENLKSNTILKAVKGSK